MTNKKPPATTKVSLHEPSITLKSLSYVSQQSMADLRGVQILSISCSFWENLANSYVGAPPPLGSWRPLLGEILDPPLTVYHLE